jgi:hypothetical protein
VEEFKESKEYEEFKEMRQERILPVIADLLSF